MEERPVFFDWLNELTDEVSVKADTLNIDYWEATGLRDDAPQNARDAFEKYANEARNFQP